MMYRSFVVLLVAVVLCAAVVIAHSGVQHTATREICVSAATTALEEK